MKNSIISDDITLITSNSEKTYINNEFITNWYWSPNISVSNIIYNFCSNNSKYHNNRVLEIGPGKTPFPLATDFIGCNESITNYIDIDIDRVRRELAFVNMSTKNKIIIRGLLTEYKQTEKLTIWEDRDFDDLSRLVVATLNCRNDVDDLVNEAQNYDELDIGLNNILNKEQQGASDEVKLALSQCLMKNYSEEKPEHIKIYAAWRENILKRGGLI